MKPLILVSNDDSYRAKGVYALIDRLVAIGDVVAVCPEHPQSGKSMALTVTEPLRIKPLPDYKGAKMYNVNGTPVDCIKLAMHHVLRRKPDIVVTGINHGSNAGVNVLYSGTMGAAMEATTFGLPAIGFSLTDHSHDADFTPCLKAVDMLVEAVLKYGLPPEVSLNVNVPNIHTLPKEMRLCEPCRGRWNDEYREYTDPFGGKFYWLAGDFENLEPDNDRTDEWALEHDMISVVPVSIERTLREEIKVDWLKSVIKNYNESVNDSNC